MNNLENVEVSDIPFIIVEANGVILKANDAACQFFNYSQEEIKGLLSNLLIADLEIINRQISPSSAEGVSIKKGFAIKRYGDKLPIEYKYYKVFDQNQKVQFALKITDYTNSCYEKEINLNAQKANNKDQFNFSSIFTENPAAGWVIDQKSFQIVDVNETALRQYGYTKTEFLEKTLLDILPPDEVIRLKNKLKNQDNLASVYTGRWKNRLKMGEIIHVEIQKNFLDDSDFILILATDITSYVRKEEFEAVIKLNNNPLINSTKDQIWSVSVDYKLMEANKSFLKLLEFSTGIQFKPGDNFLEHPFTKTFVEQWDIYFQKALKGQRVREEVSISKTSNLPATLVELYINSIFKEEEIVGTVFYVRNIPETKKAEQKIIESEKALAEAQRLARLGNWSQNLETGELKWSDQLYEIFGIQQEELLRSNRSFFHIVNKPNMQELLTAMKHARKTGESYSVIYEITTPNHERRI
ncbi:MAG: PAS domain-containing protein, partial [Ginsengibacter sp.]